MANFNQIVLLGNVGQVEVKTFANGGKRVELSLATTKRWKDRDGENREETQWHNVAIGGPLADTAERFVHKGDPLFVVGEMVYRKWTAQDGTNRSTPEVRATSFQLLPKGMKEGPAVSAVREPASSYTPGPAPAPAPAQDPDDLPF